MNKIKSLVKNEYPYIGISILIGFMFYGIYMIPHISNDGYWWVQGAKTYVQPWQFLFQNGRFSYDIILSAFNKLGIYPVYQQPIFMAISIVVMSLIAYSTYYIIKKLCENLDRWLDIILFISVMTIYFNTFFTDWFAWSECVMFIHIPGLVCAILSSWFLNKDNLRYRFLISSIMLIIAFGFYQTVGFYFFLIHTFYIVKDYITYSDFKKAIYKIVQSFFVFLVATFSQLSIGKLLQIDRANYGESDFVGNIIKILKSVPQLINENLNTMPKYVYIGLMVLAIIFIVAVIKKRIDLGGLVAILFVGLLSILFVTHIVGNEFWMVARSTTGFMALSGWLFSIGILIRSNEKESRLGSTVSVILLAFIGGYLFISFYNVQKIGVGLHITNFVDKESVNYFYTQIREYEEATKQEVKQIGFIRDKNYTYSYPGVIAHGDTNMRGYTLDWNRLNMFNYYSGREFEEVEIPSNIYEEYFEGRDWINLNNEQIVIVEDTAYICLF